MSRLCCHEEKELIVFQRNNLLRLHLEEYISQLIEYIFVDENWMQNRCVQEHSTRVTEGDNSC